MKPQNYSQEQNFGALKTTKFSQIAIVKMSGEMESNKGERRTLEMLRLKRKYVCVFVENTPTMLGMIEKVKSYVFSGEIDAETLKELIEKRGRAAGKNKRVIIAADRLMEWISRFMSGKAEFKEIGIKPFFRLHPPIGGFKKSTKLYWPQGVLGWQGKKINELIKKML